MRRRGGRRRTMRRTRRRTHRRMRRRRRRRILIGGAVLLGGGALIYKLTRQDTEKIEEHTGQSAEDLTDEELQQAMKDLNIQSQDLTDEDRAALNQEEGGGESELSYLDELEKLGKLRDEGIITDEEFEAKKQQLLNL
jgi:hypothetical protein